ncbi:MAG: methyltransferase domain-containing protein [Syntrophobacterales bacterium]|nr:methyltransferase domain-containing protein [Syntrophobacterales bacterium]
MELPNKTSHRSSGEGNERKVTSAHPARFHSDFLRRLQREERYWCGLPLEEDNRCKENMGCEKSKEELCLSNLIDGNRTYYLVDDFNQYSLEGFLEAAYRLILGRPPDAEGFRCYLEGLRSDHLTREEVLGLLRFSEEGKRRGVKIRGIRGLYFLSRARRLPVVGRIFKLLYGLAIFPSIVRRLEHCWSDVHRLEFETIKKIENQLYRLNTIEDRTEFLKGELAKITDTLIGLKATQEKFSSRLEDHVNLAKTQFRQLFDRTNTLRRVLLLLEERMGTPSHETQTEPNNTLSPIAYGFFEEDFRGDSDTLKERVRVYLSLLRSSHCLFDLPVADLGCGRGEWLRLLKEEGIYAIGVDTNDLAISFLKEENLPFAKEDIFTFLERSNPNSFSAVTAFHVIEHIPPNRWVSFLRSIWRALAPGGIAIIETPNPRNILVSAGDFYRDPTHIYPVFPDTLEFLGEITGFENSTAWFFDENRSRLIPVKSVRFDSIHSYLSVSRDFAWSGRKPLA